MKKVKMTAAYSFAALLVITGIMALVGDPTKIPEKIALFMGTTWLLAATLFAFSLLLMMYISLFRFIKREW